MSEIHREEQETDRVADDKPVTERVPYKKPTIRDYGDVSQLTAGTGSLGGDAVMSGMGMGMG